MAINKDLLERVADHIEMFPDSYDQTEWGYAADGPSSTVGCVAGWALVLHYGHAVCYPVMGEYLPLRWDCRGPNDDGEPIRDHATRILGLADDVASALFDLGWKPTTTVPDALRAIARGADVRDVTAVTALTTTTTGRTER